jgi:hypothetical protein
MSQTGNIVDRRAPGPVTIETHSPRWLVVDGGAAVAIADQPQRDHISALRFKAVVIEPESGSKLVNVHRPWIVLTRRHCDGLREMAPSAIERQRDRRFALFIPAQ